MNTTMNKPEIRATTTNEQWNRDAATVSGLDLAIGSKTLVSGVEFTISRGDRICLLGRNGCGKSTLFHWISQHGHSAAQAAAWSIYEVAQELPATEQSVLQVVLAAHIERGALWKRQAELEIEDRDMTDAELEEYNDIGARLHSMKADADPPRAQKILAGLGFSAEDVERPLSTFSGGWRARVALAQGLFMEPDLLLLDEPTNHLDLNAVLWLQEFCSSWPTTLIVISHNAGFVRRISNTLWFMQSGRLRTYKCSYNRFLKQREQELKKQTKDWEALEKEAMALKKKGTPAAKKSAEELLAKRAREGVCRPEKTYAPKFFFIESDDSVSRVGPLIKTEDAVIGYSAGTPVLAGATFALFQGSRVALVGANGSGKSTLLKFLEGELPAMDGVGFVSRRPKLSVCKFDQHFYHSLPEDKTPMAFLDSLVPLDAESGAKRVGYDVLRKVLGASGLEGAAHTQLIGTLSGGQKARVYFASISIMSPDILLLDEPTNHLDMETVEGLSSALKDFPGAMVIVSHDVDFLEELATEVWVTRDGSLKRLSEGPEGLETYVNAIVNSYSS